MATVKREGNKVYALIADRMRYIGEIYTMHIDGKALGISVDRSEDLGEISGCYKFPKAVIDTDWFDHVGLVETDGNETNRYWIPREDIIKWNAHEHDTHYWIGLGALKKYKS